jgi:hypothetical protein
MALPEDQLRLPKYLRYRLALAVLPSLAWARARFVARVVHRDPASWSAAVADLIRWHATAKDEAAQWPGRAAQESQITEAGGGDDAEGGEGGEAAEAAGSGEAAEVAPEATLGVNGSDPGAGSGEKSKLSGTSG